MVAGSAPDPVESEETTAATPPVDPPDADAGAASGDLRADSGARRRLVFLVAVAVAVAVLGAAWTLASPVGAAPDDGFHLASIWCSPTAPDDACTNQGDAFAAGKDFVEVPAEIGPAAHCYAFDPYQSAACQDAIESGTRVRSLANDGIYPGLFHAAMGLAVGDEPVNSALLARLLSWAICVAFLTAGWYVLPRRHRLGYLIVLLVTSIPRAMSLWPSTNPSGVVVASVVAAWCAVVALLHARERRQLAVAGTLLVTSLVAAAGSRADGGVYALVAVAAACLLAWGSRSDVARPVAVRRLVGIGVAAGTALVFSLTVLTRRVVGVEELVTPVDRSTVEQAGGLMWNNLREITFFLTANLGTAPIGWGDTPIPRIIWMSTLASFFGLAFWGIGRMDRFKALSLACVLGGLFGVPYFLLWRGGYPVGFEINARYVLPLVPVLGFTLLHWRRSTSVASLGAVQLWTVLVLMTIAHSVALHSNIRRYVTGVEVLSIDLDTGREWWWDIAITPNMVWVLGSLAFAALAVVLGVAIRRSAAAGEEPDDEHVPELLDDPTYA